jgi:hypothetical protein
MSKTLVADRLVEEMCNTFKNGKNDVRISHTKSERQSG